MNSLQELNTFGSETLDVLDNRPSGVKFNREYPLIAQDQTFTALVDPYGGQTFQSIGPGIEIVEIINYQTANVRYRVTIVPGSTTPLTGSAILFTPTLPSGASLTQVGNVYTISGIHSVSDWDQVKNFTWQLPSNFNTFPLWYLEVSVIYYDSALSQDVTKSWIAYDDRFYYIAELQAQATTTAIIGVNSPAVSSLTGSASLLCDIRVIVDAASSLSATAAFTSDINVNVDYLSATGSMTSTIRFTANTAVNIGATANVTCSPTVSVTGLTSRTYTANQGNNIFGTNTPVVSTPNPADSLSITISSSLGYFTLGNGTVPTGSLTITGTASQINSQLIPSSSYGVYFYPTKNISSSGTITWAQSRNGTLEFTTTIPITGFAASADTSTVTITTSTNDYRPTVNQVYYTTADILVVGGGGGGSYTGGGGGGQVRLLSNFAFEYVNYSITIGAGGTQGSDYAFDPNNPPATIDVSGSTGGQTTFAKESGTIYAQSTGGQGARAVYTRTSLISGPPVTYRYDTIDVSGGSSPGYVTPSGSNGTQAGASVIGNFDSIQDNWVYVFGIGGGGAGANSARPVYPNLGYQTGGNGYQWTGSYGNNQYYGGGGGAVGYAGGLGGGGTGWSYINYLVTPNSVPGTANTGGGGGGGQYESVAGVPTPRPPAAGGSGVVIIKFRG